MKRLSIAIVLLGVSVSAGAQTPTPTPVSDRMHAYVTAVGGGTVARKNGVDIGLQAGIAVTPEVEVFGEAGRLTNVPNKAMQDAAAVVTGFLSGLGKGAATSKVKAPANYGVAGLRYLFLPDNKYVPYASVAAGGATVEKDPTFSLAGNDVSKSLGTYGVALGQDLSGKQTRFMTSVAAGVRASFGQVIADFGIKYDRIFTKGEGTNVGGAYIGLGYRF